VGIQIAVQIQALHSQLILLVGQHLFGGNDPGLDDALFMVEVGEKHVQRLDPLNAATFDNPPFTGGNAARDGVEGNQALGALLIPVEGESDPGAVKQQIGFTPALGQQFSGGFGQPAGELAVMRANLPCPIVHFVVISADHAVLLVTRTQESSQGPCQRHKHLKISELNNSGELSAPSWCAECPVSCRALHHNAGFDYQQHSQC